MGTFKDLSTLEKGLNEQTLQVGRSWSAVVQERSSVEPVTRLECKGYR